MRKFVLIAVVILVALAAIGVGVASAQGEQPPFGPGRRGGAGNGPMHAYVVEALAEALDLETAAVNTRLLGGETMQQIALSEGIEPDELAGFLRDVHEAAFDKAVADGTLTDEQATFMRQRRENRLERRGLAAGDCPMHGSSGQIMRWRWQTR
jgi:hypothetical protein